MPRYIDANKLLKKIFPIGMVDDGRYTINAKAVKHAIDQTPTADVVEVVRCKDCVHYCGFEHCTNGICDLDTISKRAVCTNDFCSYGERKVE
jgi:hypothetical protein